MIASEEPSASGGIATGIRRALRLRPVHVALAILAFVFLLAHLPYLPSTLEDIDSANFALGVRDFDVASHRPHPPGYPIYIVLGKFGVSIARLLSGDASPSAIEARTLAVLSLIGGAVIILLAYRVFACFSNAARTALLPPVAPWHAIDARALAATALAVSCPLFWYVAVRPMSDMPGLAAALAAQTCLALAWWRQQPDAAGDRRLSPDAIAASGGMIVAGALLSAIATGFRSQNAMLTVPLLLLVLLDRIGRGVAGALIGSSVAFAVGLAAWSIPLLIASGGLAPYQAALGFQAAADFEGVQMLYLTPGDARLLAATLVNTFILPWDTIVLGGAVLLLAAVGVVALLVRETRTLWAVLAISVPYLVFHLLFQDTNFTRYALPLVLPVAFLAVAGLEAIASRALVPVTAVLVVVAMIGAMPIVMTYGSEASPTRRAVDAINQAASRRPPGALAMHQTFRRPLEAETVAVTSVLPSPPRREWLELARYWREGHSEPLWFLADPQRSDLALVDPQSRVDRVPFDWTLPGLERAVGGMRPSAVTWFRLSAPGWFAEEGWALTPETAGIARLMGRGPHLGPITARVRRRADAARMLIGGRHLGAETDPPIGFVATLDGREVARWDARAGFFLKEFDLPAGALIGGGDLAQLAIVAAPVASANRIDAAIEQFDLQPLGTLMWGYDEGWHEAEYNPQLGVWRWTSQRAVLRIVDATTPVKITMRIESPRRYFDGPSLVRVVAGTHVLLERAVESDDEWAVTVAPDVLREANGRVTLETSQTFVPADRGAPDRRMLGLRVFEVDVVPKP